MLSSPLIDIYLGIVNSKEYNSFFKDLDFDISWLEGKLNREDLLKLEELITVFSQKMCQKNFECGFVYAWRLFVECQEKDANK